MKDQIGKDNRKNDNSRIEKDTVYRDRETSPYSKEGRNAKGAQEGKLLVGVFEKVDEALDVINRLKEVGYKETEITVAVKDDEKREQLDDQADIAVDSQAYAEKMSGGAAIGGALGGLYAALPALGLVTIPGIGPILAAGPLVGILGGVAAGGLTGGLIGALVEYGVDEEDAKSYEYLVDQGKIIILVENKENLLDDVYMAFRQNNTIVGGRKW
ncbi:MAG: general stress protein [Gudongella sp.]|nr:general stress protein [Gudongella sp.]